MPLHHRPPSPRRPRGRPWAAALALAAVLARAAAGEAAAPPAALAQALPEARLHGQGQLRFFGLQVYEARLWTGPGFAPAEFQAHPLALELHYQRGFAGSAIARRSVQEIERQGALPPAQARRWQDALAAVLPDVQPGDRLTGLYQPGLGMRLWRGAQALGAIDDAELARRFFGIWLSPQTSEPGLREALLGQASGAAP